MIGDAQERLRSVPSSDRGRGYAVAALAHADDLLRGTERLGARHLRGTGRRPWLRRYLRARAVGFRLT